MGLRTALANLGMCEVVIFDADTQWSGSEATEFVMKGGGLQSHGVLNSSPKAVTCSLGDFRQEALHFSKPVSSSAPVEDCRRVCVGP